MNLTKGKEILLWMLQEIKTITYGEIHVVLKVHDARVVLIERSKICKEKPE